MSKKITLLGASIFLLSTIVYASEIKNDFDISMLLQCQKDAITIALQSSKTHNILEVTPEYSKATHANGQSTISHGDKFLSNQTLFDFFNKQCMRVKNNEINVNNVQKLEKHSALYRTYLAAHHKIKCPQQNCAWYLYDGSPVPGNYGCWNTK